MKYYYGCARRWIDTVTIFAHTTNGDMPSDVLVAKTGRGKRRKGSSSVKNSQHILLSAHQRKSLRFDAEMWMGGRAIERIRISKYIINVTYVKFVKTPRQRDDDDDDDEYNLVRRACRCHCIHYYYYHRHPFVSLSLPSSTLLSLSSSSPRWCEQHLKRVWAIVFPELFIFIWIPFS